MAKKNCWEVLKCGREKGGAKAAELGVCPAALLAEYNGVNDGMNAGRMCWAVAGTLCEGTPSGKFVSKLTTCMKCEFYQEVVREEGRSVTIHPSAPKKGT